METPARASDAPSDSLLGAAWFYGRSIGKCLSGFRYPVPLEEGSERTLGHSMKRAPLQGVRTVLRFNWHLYAIGFGVMLACLALSAIAPGHLRTLLLLAALGSAVGLAIPTLATWHAYDATGLYELSWLSRWLGSHGEGANIHAGFDETTALLEDRFPGVRWQVFDFYDPAKHTEISIQRARRTQVPHSKTLSIRSTSLPLADRSLDYVVLMLAAHEVRDPHERVAFFAEVSRVLRPHGKVLVIEHLRDWVNIAAYSLGAWHFHPRHEWMRTFQQAGFIVGDEFHPNCFITTFVLIHRENTP